MVGALDTVIDQCLDMMFAEGPGSGSAHGHYVNMTNRSYAQVACGVSTGPRRGLDREEFLLVKRYHADTPRGSTNFDSDAIAPRAGGAPVDFDVDILLTPSPNCSNAGEQSSGTMTADVSDHEALRPAVLVASILSVGMAGAQASPFGPTSSPPVTEQGPAFAVGPARRPEPKARRSLQSRHRPRRCDGTGGKRSSWMSEASPR